MASRRQGRNRTDVRSRSAQRDQSRTLHLIDADNLLRDPQQADSEAIADVLFAYRRAAGYRPGDQVVLAASRDPLHAAALLRAWPNVDHRWRGGADGADLELLDAAQWAAASRRFQRIVLGSGDRIFLEALDQLRRTDLTVEVVGRRANMAPALAVRAGGVSYVDDVMRRRARESAETQTA